jgi:hypothetical protein
MLNACLVILSLAGTASAVVLAILNLRLCTFDQLISVTVLEFLIRGIFHTMVMTGAIALAILLLLQLKTPIKTLVRPTIDSRKPFITQGFFRNIVAALIAAGYLALVLMFLNKV